MYLIKKNAQYWKYGTCNGEGQWTKIGKNGQPTININKLKRFVSENKNIKYLLNIYLLEETNTKINN